MYAVAHAFIGAGLITIIGTTPVYGALGAILPDIDILVAEIAPISHRGLLHTPLIAVFLTAVLYLATGDRDDALALGTGYLSHLFLDTFTPSGIMWLFPWAVAFSHDAATAKAVDVNLVLAGIGVIGMQYDRLAGHYEQITEQSKPARTVIVVLVMVVAAGATSITGSLDPQGYDTRTIEQIVTDQPISEKVSIAGTVDEIRKPYEGGQTTYQKIVVSDAGYRVLVFCSTTNGEADVSTGDDVVVDGTVSKFNGDIQLETRCIDINSNA